MATRLTAMPVDMAISHILHRTDRIIRAIASGSPADLASAARMMRYDCLEMESVGEGMAKVLREVDQIDLQR